MWKMINDYGFKAVEQLNYFTDDFTSKSTLYFPVTDDPDFPAELRAKTETLIDEVLRQIQARYGIDPVCSKLVLSARIEVYCRNSDNLPGYDIQVGICDDTEIDAWTQYEIETSDPLYRPFKDYMMKQMERNLFK